MEIEIVKCSNCKGTGRIPTNRGGGEYVACPVCKGRGKKAINTNRRKSK